MFSMSGAKAPKKSYPKEKLVPGEHLCRVLNVREVDGHYGHAFFLDFEVVEGPSGKGFQHYHKVNPDDAKASGKMTATMARALEMGKIQQAVAAVYGFTAAQADKVDDEVYEASIAKDGGFSPLRGRLIVVNCVPHINKAEKEAALKEGRQPVANSSYYEILPYVDGPQPVVAGAAANTNATPAAAPKKAPPAPPAAKRTFEDAAKAAGFVERSDFPGWFYNETTEEQLDTDDLKARLGFANAA